MSRTDQVTQIATRLEQAILGGEFAPGERLPSERVLSARLGVSRSVVREALGRLTSLGLVRSQHGSGTRVEAPSPRQLAVGYQRLLAGPDFRLEHLAEVRLPLEVAIAALAAAHRTDAHLARLEKTQKVLGNPRGSLEKHVAADVDFHQALAEATGNPLFSVVLAPIQKLLIESRRRTLGRFGSELAHRHHAKILTAVAARDEAAAAAAMREHLEANVVHLRQVEDGKVV
jgi:GntR family transcriptional regulator, transcriptional repressor for pyruvate dehydrogenase complex